ncbi:MAG: 1-deoxy-D-xylulose-5-phosphate reductoisomerase [Spirochaetes bacterium GWF1_31_7]|nr:MAG: 1-deoxy-D-xylulose-5-phosphate reductoisomerase [Spirochaetes bacterium GWE1_32_154]OHD46493.1 MAG: 1-deoxy-D-xylulose-5-phosphate reductoisomerase [Spirochaetes bacterium GWE2_31_10]OHD46726.1 MAG: 1-deoxy-D-xylulose-5-phosphate reductoisomerase [Spirochaetes bacterium GWF1_31_7]OHD81167.1 MAG: 1-deoxy-D-xylulose-5-phosphate reductoisomerase [Spirochaetes bacterium RIFOXYB1_FULL_32_8]HBD93383.1 1-deoxy-D-xylulose-5-phosphate reductoisomerase [Spirochaetia bacterium]
MSVARRISILGVTGSIGKSALKVIDNNPDKFVLVSISTHKNLDELICLINKYSPEFAVCTDIDTFVNRFNSFQTKINNTLVYTGSDVLDRITKDTSNDIILNAISGKAGLVPSVSIINSGIKIALANKESIVCAGDILLSAAKKNNIEIIPVDSEHSAIYFLLYGKNRSVIDKLHITASGGPFLNRDKSSWSTISISEALNHPTWSMGKKISIDSATMANKGLEVIEAHYLFSMDYDKINVLIHPQSIIHSMVETIDGEVYAQLGPKDMAIPIMNALFHPDIVNNSFNRLDFTKSFNLSLEPVDFNKFKMLEFAYYCGKKGGYYPAFYNFINEYLVDLFINQKISFLEIEKKMEYSLNSFEKGNPFNSIVTIEGLLELDRFCNLI